ncbi:MAG: hypothetical protein AAF570_29035, partial [Bacteroidota bacterium]
MIEIYPSADTLPENLLRFHILFSQPMKAVDNLQHLQLLDQNGKPVDGAIFNNVHELWDRDQRQLTLILDPARVKTGLQAHERLGRALTIGETFQLVLQTAEDIHGNRIAQPFVKTFHVGPPDLEAPDISRWRINAPHAHTQTPLRLDLPAPADRMSLIH